MHHVIGITFPCIKAGFWTTNQWSLWGLGPVFHRIKFPNFPNHWKYKIKFPKIVKPVKDPVVHVLIVLYCVFQGGWGKFWEGLHSHTGNSIHDNNVKIVYRDWQPLNQLEERFNVKKVIESDSCARDAKEGIGPLCKNFATSSSTSGVLKTN